MGLSLFVTDFCTLGDKKLVQSHREQKGIRNQASMPSFAVRTIMLDRIRDWLRENKASHCCLVGLGSYALSL